MFIPEVGTQFLHNQEVKTCDARFKGSGGITIQSGEERIGLHECYPLTWSKSDYADAVDLIESICCEEGRLMVVEALRVSMTPSVKSQLWLQLTAEQSSVLTGVEGVKAA